MTLYEYLSQSGTQSKLAADLSISTAQVWQWKEGRRPVPYEYAAAIEASSGGAVTRKDLFPEDWKRIWPELARASKRAVQA